MAGKDGTDGLGGGGGGGAAANFAGAGNQFGNVTGAGGDGVVYILTIP